MTSEPKSTSGLDFIRTIIQEDLNQQKNEGRVVTRFPPEPNGYLHIGHAKSICLNFSLAKEFGGRCHLRFDDTNPAKEEVEYAEAIKRDIEWLGFEWGEHLYHASDYFGKLHDFAVELIKAGKAYVCELTAEETRTYRGTLTEPGKESPFRNRSVEENLNQFEKMTNGEFKDGSKTLKAKIDMASPNINLRDPVIYRIKRIHHHRTGSDWCLYPMYDFAHGLSDMLEGVTHSICTLEFEDHRPLYDWYLDELKTPCHPQQIEFARLNVDYAITSKRKLLQLVTEKHVSGWDDPRMPTLSGMRRRGFTPAAIRSFCERIGVGKKNNVISMGILEEEVRNDLNEVAPRVMGVLDPIKVTITTLEEPVECNGPVHPKKEEMGRRQFRFTKEIYIDREDFKEDPPPKYHRLKPGGEVRLRYAFVIRCEKVIKDDSGRVVALECTHLPDTFQGKTPEGMKKVKGIIHWVSAEDAVKCTVRVYDRLFKDPNPAAAGDAFLDTLNPDSLSTLESAFVESNFDWEGKGQPYQFERLGYFTLDSVESSAERPIFNRTATLRDTWAK